MSLSALAQPKLGKEKDKRIGIGQISEQIYKHTYYI